MAYFGSVLCALCPLQVFIYNLMGWPLPVDPKKDEDKTLEDVATNQPAGGNDGTDVRRPKTTGGVTKVESVEQWKTLLQVGRNCKGSDPAEKC